MLDRQIDFETARQVHTVLVLHFLEGLKQSEIAKRLNLSTSKVNRLIAQGRRLGMVKIEIESQFQQLVDLETALVSATSLSDAIVTPTVSGNPDTTLQQVGRAAASRLLATIRDGDIIAITGGKAISALVDNLNADRPFDVTVVPLTGGVQGKYFTDVNHLATRLAERLGGRAMLMHAPLFAETRAQRDMLFQVASVREVFDLARRATVALVGIGSIEPSGSSYYDLNPLPGKDRQHLMETGVVGEFLAHLIHEDGQVAAYATNACLVALAPGDPIRHAQVIGIAAGPEKVRPIDAVLNGGYISSLVIDEATATSVIEQKKGNDHAA
ncbi:sugar-binding transcriptional regulator [Oceaniglobus indicus]|uniref:sugar-binding transcriptional regulator n=1 Tax=Oceaniglobus indicus TaxID=2047749 RepID=UPI000C19154F|nr:sugar-binding transcriptional regulator [Oceaniglobus indicus]